MDSPDWDAEAKRLVPTIKLADVENAEFLLSQALQWAQKHGESVGLAKAGKIMRGTDKMEVAVMGCLIIGTAVTAIAIVLQLAGVA